MRTSNSIVPFSKSTSASRAAPLRNRNTARPSSSSATTSPVSNHSRSENRTRSAATVGESESESRSPRTVATHPRARGLAGLADEAALVRDHGDLVSLDGPVPTDHLLGDLGLELVEVSAVGGDDVYVGEGRLDVRPVPRRQ